MTSQSSRREQKILRQLSQLQYQWRHLLRTSPATASRTRSVGQAQASPYYGAIREILCKLEPFSSETEPPDHRRKISTLTFSCLIIRRFLRLTISRKERHRGLVQVVMMSILSFLRACKALAGFATIGVLAGCTGTSQTPISSERLSSIDASPWTCSERLSAFGELTVLCSITADYVEGSTVIMRYQMYCSLESGEDSGYVISRFSGRDLNGNSVDWHRLAEVSFDSGPKEKLTLRPLTEAFTLDSEQFGIDSLRVTDSADPVHSKVLPETETMLIRAMITPSLDTTTSRFTWGDFGEPKNYLAERGCVW